MLTQSYLHSLIILWAICTIYRKVSLTANRCNLNLNHIFTYFDLFIFCYLFILFYLLFMSYFLYVICNLIITQLLFVLIILLTVHFNIYLTFIYYIQV